MGSVTDPHVGDGDRCKTSRINSHALRAATLVCCMLARYKQKTGINLASSGRRVTGRQPGGSSLDVENLASVVREVVRIDLWLLFGLLFPNVVFGIFAGG